MERDEREEFNRVVDHEVKGHFPAGAVRRAVLLRQGDEPGIEAGQLLLRVFTAAPDEQGLAVWRDTHRAEVDELRRDLSRRLPSARLLELTFDEPGAPRISMPDDGSPRRAAVRAGDRDQDPGAGASELRVPRAGRAGRHRDRGQAGGGRVRPAGRDHAHRAGHPAPAGGYRRPAPGADAR